jgi:3-hydroxyacyl-CoA dehydrogenase
MRTALPDDPFHALFATPPLLAALVAKSALGQKAGAGFFRKRGKTIEVLDRTAGDYVVAQGSVAPEVLRLLDAADARARLAALR